MSCTRRIIHAICLLTALFFVTGAASAFPGLDYFQYDGIERTYLLHVPDTYVSTGSYALVVVLHGGGGNAAAIEETTRFSEVAEREGFIVVYPNGTGRFPRRLLTWNSGYIDVWASENDIDDSGFITALVDRLTELYSVDPDMIFVTGISNGAMMAYRLATEHSDVFSAVGAVAGSIGGRSDGNKEPWRIPEPASPVSAVIFHGMLDSHILYDGGVSQTWLEAQRGRIDMSVDDAVDFFVQANWCLPVPEVEALGNGSVIRETWTGGDRGSEVVLYTITDAGHSWPGGSRWLQGDPPTSEISATELIWEFFESHPGSP